MTKKPTVSSVPQTTNNVTTINNNFSNIREAFSNTLSLDGSTPNAMQADLDMNSNDLLNAGAVYATALSIRGIDVETYWAATLTAAEEAAASAAEAAASAATALSVVSAHFEPITYTATQGQTQFALPAGITSSDNLFVTATIEGLTQFGITFTGSDPIYAVLPSSPVLVAGTRVVISGHYTINRQEVLDAATQTGVDATMAEAFAKPYATRAAAVAAIPGLDETVTRVSWFSDAVPNANVQVMSVARLSGATLITDMAGWVPVGMAAPEHMTDNTTPGTTDMTAAFQAILDAGQSVRTLSTRYLLTDQIEVPQGCAIVPDTPIAAMYWDNTGLATGSLRYHGGTVFMIDHGEGVEYSDVDNSTYYANSAVLLNNDASISGVGFWYPEQPMGTFAGDTVAYPPAIALTTNNRRAHIKGVNIGNAYVGIDAWRDHGRLTIRDITGFPIYRGIRIGSMDDNAHVENVHFAGRQVFFSDEGESWQASDVPEWVDLNGAVMELGRVTWTDFNSVFGIGYKYGVLFTNQTASPSNGINWSGSPQNCTFNNPKFDSCRLGFYGNGTYHGGITINAPRFAPKSLYDASATGCFAFYLVQGGGTVTSINIQGGEVWGAAGMIGYIEASPQTRIEKLVVRDFGANEGGRAIILHDCPDSSVEGVQIDNPNAETGIGGIQLIDCDRSRLLHNTVNDLDLAPIAWSGDYQTVEGNRGTGNTLRLLVDENSTAKYFSSIRNNRDDQLLDFGNSDVSSGILQLPPGADEVNYSGTAAVRGITHGQRGQDITIRYSAVSTTYDDDGAASATQILRLNGNFVSSANDALLLRSRGNLGWLEVSRSAN